MHTPSSRRAMLFAPFILVIFSLLIIIWSAGQVLISPSAGADWSQSTGVVVTVDEDGPAQHIHVGDRIVAIDNVPLGKSTAQQPKAVGDSVSFRLLRDGVEREVEVQLVAPRLSTVLLRLLPLLVALAFWLVNAIVLALKPTGIQSRLFLLFCQIFVWTLAFGVSSFSGSQAENLLFQSLLWWVGPIAIHFHLHFPLPFQSRASRISLLSCYLVAMMGTLLTLSNALLLSFIPTAALFGSSLIWMTGCLIGVVFLLWRAYHHATTLEIQRQIRLVALGGGVAFVSFLLLLLLPYALIQQSLLPYDIVFLLLLIIPLTYGYAILSYRLIRLDPYVSRIAAYTLVLSSLIGMYFILNIMLSEAIPSSNTEQTANLVTIVALTSTSLPLYRRLQTIVNHIFYGGSYDYRSAVQLVSRTLDQPGNPEMLPQILSEGIQKAMQLECVRMLLPDAQGTFTLVGLSCLNCNLEDDRFRLSSTSQIAQYLRDHPYPVYGPEMRSHLNNATLSAQETWLLSSEHSRLWVPLSSVGQLLGLCILGPKRGSEIFDVTDLEILQVIMRLSSTTMQNIRFIDELQQQAAEQEKLHQQALNAREEERKHVARELHDQIIQSLAGMNYQLTTLRGQAGSEYRDQILHLQANLQQSLDDVRRICADLRPPALDNLGLVSAVRSRLRALEEQSSLKVVLHVEGNPQQPIPEDIAIGLFRVMQEALSNIVKHAEAQSVEVQLYLQPNEICLLVRDDGKGFQVPERLGQLLEGQHFGLVGLRERLDMIHGTLYVSSAPDDGTCIRACAPIALSQDHS